MPWGYRCEPSEDMKAEADRPSVMTEANTSRELVTPKLVNGGWFLFPFAIGEQPTFTNGRTIVVGGKVRCGKQRRAYYLLQCRRDCRLERLFAPAV